MSSLATGPQQQTASIYERIGVRTIINAAGATTAVGGTLMPPEVIEAMISASQSFVVIDELNRAVGKKIAEITGAEDGYVTSGSAAAMLVAVAGCIAGTDPVKIRKLPDSEGMANEVIIHRMHRIGYDQMFRAAGGRLVEIGMPRRTEPWELESAINERTACVVWIDSPATGPGPLPFEQVVEIAHGRGVPVVVDAASTLPPKNHITRWIAAGADLAIYSGGKGIRGPQDSGLLAGRADLIAAARANGAPNTAVGRAAKVSKEAMAGLYVALERFAGYDHEAEHAERAEMARMIAGALDGLPGVEVVPDLDPEAYPMPVVKLYPARGASWTPAAIGAHLAAGEPSIHGKIEWDHYGIHTHCLQPGDAEQIIEAVRQWGSRL
ncbi:MAG TPA: aminotransferase class V-fold PLP-dependent enzyme [Thermomicrobiales bacterium]|nr:aminotransferase class V-fold PLP-dependent enzyme [Thermomicrobiales bacterium]